METECHSTPLTFLADRGLGAEQDVWNSTQLAFVNHTSTTPLLTTQAPLLQLPPLPPPPHPPALIRPLRQT